MSNLSYVSPTADSPWGTYLSQVDRVVPYLGNQARWVETLKRPKRALIVDVPDGKGHMVLFGLRPYWRWQTQGSYFLGFNAILNWDHLDAGSPPKPAPAKPEGTKAEAAKPAA